MKSIFELQEDILKLASEEMPIKPYFKVRDILKELVTAKEIYADDECHCECENCKKCNNK